MDKIWEEYQWLSFSDAADFLEVEPRKIRSWVRELALLALPRVPDAKLCVPQVFLEKNAQYSGPLETLRGTIVLLKDGGFSDQEAVFWLLNVEDTLRSTPIQALREGRKKKVRQVAAAAAI